MKHADEIDTILGWTIEDDVISFGKTSEVRLEIRPRSSDEIVPRQHLQPGIDSAQHSRDILRAVERDVLVNILVVNARSWSSADSGHI